MNTCCGCGQLMRSQRYTPAAMALLSNTEQANEILERMSVAELDKIIERATKLRPTRIFPFLKLPPELRNRIYRFAIQPEDIEKHVKNGKAPALLKINHQVSAEFRGIYYSYEFMNLEYYDHDTKCWIKEKDAKYLRIILARKGCCRLHLFAKHLPPKEFIV